MANGIIRENFNTASEKAYIIISEKILSGELKPGTKLSKRKMAELTGVSVIPVIEALNRLEDDGLVESRPQWGSFVIVPTPEKVKDMYSLREAIECQIARILARRITDSEAQVLYEMAYVLDNTMYSPDIIDDLNRHHVEFHTKMAEFAASKSLINSIKRMNLFWILCKAAAARRIRSPLPSGWHKRLVDSFVEGDQDHAEKIMRTHVNDSLESILEDLKTSFNDWDTY